MVERSEPARRAQADALLARVVSGLQEPYWFLYEKGPIAVMHGSPWRYDSYVPILFAGPGIAPRTIYRRAHPVDVAPTLASYLGLKPPSSAVGLPLEEVLR